MPWRQKAMKGVEDCEKLGVAVKQALIPRYPNQRVDVEQERQRLGKELERLEGQLRGTEARLSSEQFTARAPAEIVAKEREKATSLRDQRDRLAAKLKGLG
jgi:valyl-tRNA synthetase